MGWSEAGREAGQEKVVSSAGGNQNCLGDEIRRNASGGLRGEGPGPVT